LRAADVLEPSGPPHTARPPPIPHGVDWQHADVRDGRAVAEVLRGVDAVCPQEAVVSLGQDVADARSMCAATTWARRCSWPGMAEVGLPACVLASSMVVCGEGRYACLWYGVVRPGLRRCRTWKREGSEPMCPRGGDSLAAGLVEEDAPADPRNVCPDTQAPGVPGRGMSAGDPRRVAALRRRNVYGPGTPWDNSLRRCRSLFRPSLARGEAPSVFADGGKRRDFRPRP
jgi:dTDP-L-rhamnose 4-epimerase